MAARAWCNIRPIWQYAAASAGGHARAAGYTTADRVAARRDGGRVTKVQLPSFRVKASVFRHSAKTVVRQRRYCRAAATPVGRGARHPCRPRRAKAAARRSARVSAAVRYI